MNKTTNAIVLHYDEISAPRVTAKGIGDLAEQIIELAEEYDIPVHEEPEIVSLLSHVELGDEIPEPLYIAIAEILAFAYMLKGKIPHSDRNLL